MRVNRRELFIQGKELMKRTAVRSVAAVVGGCAGVAPCDNQRPIHDAQQIIKSKLTEAEKKKLEKFLTQLNDELEELATHGDWVAAVQGGAFGLLLTNGVYFGIDQIKDLAHHHKTHELPPPPPGRLEMARRVFCARTPVNVSLALLAVSRFLGHNDDEYVRVPDKNDLENTISKALKEVDIPDDNSVNEDAPKKRIIDDTAGRKLASLLFSLGPMAYLTAGLGFSYAIQGFRAESLKQILKVQSELIESRSSKFIIGEHNGYKLSDYIPKALRRDGQQFEIEISSPRKDSDPIITKYKVEYFQNNPNAKIEGHFRILKDEPESNDDVEPVDDSSHEWNLEIEPAENQTEKPASLMDLAGVFWEKRNIDEIRLNEKQTVSIRALSM